MCFSSVCCRWLIFSPIVYSVGCRQRAYPARSDIMVGTVPSICTVVAAGEFCGVLWADSLFCFFLAIVSLLGCLLWLRIVHRHRGHKNRCSFCNLRRAVALGVISKVRTSRTNERTFIWHFTPSPVLKRKCDRQWEKCMADGLNCQDLFQRSSSTTDKGVHQTLVIEGTGFQWNPHSSSQPAQAMPSVSRMQERFPGGSASIAKRTRWQSLTVEKYDFYSFFSLFLHAQKRMAGVDLLGVELEWVLAPSNWPSKAQSISANQPLPHACTFRLGDQATTLDTFLESNSVSNTGRTSDGQAFFFFFFFFLLSIAQRNRSKPPPPDMKVLSFVRDVWNFEMTPYCCSFLSILDIACSCCSFADPSSGSLVRSCSFFSFSFVVTQSLSVVLFLGLFQLFILSRSMVPVFFLSVPACVGCCNLLHGRSCGFTWFSSSEVDTVNMYVAGCEVNCGRCCCCSE